MSSSSNHGMSVKKTVISKSIDLGNRFPNMNNNSNQSKIQIGSEQKLQDSQIKDLSQAFLS